LTHVVGDLLKGNPLWNDPDGPRGHPSKYLS
jgi:hypothetical protein